MTPQSSPDNHLDNFWIPSLVLQLKKQLFLPYLTPYQ